MSQAPLVLRFGNRDAISGENCSPLACGLPPNCPRYVVDHVMQDARKLSDESGRDVRIVCDKRDLAMGGVVR